MRALTEALVKLTNVETPSKKKEIKKVDKELQKSLIESVKKVDTKTCRNSNDLTIAYQRALQEGIENIYPNNCWYDITKCNIYATLCDTKNDVNATIDKILTEAIITGHTEEEYFDKFGDKYDEGELWDFSREDIETGAIEPDDNMDYWLIDDRYFEVPKELTEDADEFSDEEIEVESEELPTEVDIAFDDFDISLEDGIELVLKHKFDNEVSDFDYDVHDDSVFIHDIEWEEDEKDDSLKEDYVDDEFLSGDKVRFFNDYY